MSRAILPKTVNGSGFKRLRYYRAIVAGMYYLFKVEDADLMSAGHLYYGFSLYKKLKTKKYVHSLLRRSFEWLAMINNWEKNRFQNYNINSLMNRPNGFFSYDEKVDIRRSRLSWKRFFKRWNILNFP